MSNQAIEPAGSVVPVFHAEGLSTLEAAEMGHGPMGGAMAGPLAGQQLMTPEERTALMEKMRSAKTPEERQKLAKANHAEMQKRAKEKGITLPEHRGPMGFGGPPK